MEAEEADQVATEVEEEEEEEKMVVVVVGPYNVGEDGDD